MQKRIILDSELLSVTIDRLCQQLIENHQNFENTVLIGLQPRGTFFASRIHKRLEEVLGKNIPFGMLDITFFRDDFRRRDKPIKANTTHMPFVIEGCNVILIDDVLFTGRSIRAAMDALVGFGRPAHVELMVLIDRKYTRELPVQADYVGLAVNSILSQKVIVDWKGVDGMEEDNVWLVGDLN